MLRCGRKWNECTRILISRNSKYLRGGEFCKTLIGEMILCFQIPDPDFNSHNYHNNDSIKIGTRHLGRSGVGTSNE